MASTAACEPIEDSLKLSGKKSFAGIPEATFVVSSVCEITTLDFFFVECNISLYRWQEDVDAYMKDREGVESILRQLDEQHGMFI